MFLYKKELVGMKNVLEADDMHMVRVTNAGCCSKRS